SPKTASPVRRYPVAAVAPCVCSIRAKADVATAVSSNPTVTRSMRHLYTSRPYPPGWSRFTRFAASRRYDGQDAASRRSIMGPGPRLAILALACAMAIPADAAARDARYDSERSQMVAEIQAMA